MIRWGINALNHGSSLAVFNYDDLVYYRVSKNDRLDNDIIYNAFHHGGPSEIYWYEKPLLKKARQAYAGQWRRVFDFDELPSNYIKTLNVNYAKVKYTPHHASHAAAGYYTSPFNHCAVVVLDAIGEWECASIWHGQGANLKRVWHRNYPNSLGLFYSAFAHLVGYKPILEEHLFQQDSDKGDPVRFYNEVRDYFNGIVSLKENLHKGVMNWKHPLASDQDKFDLAAAVQRVFEEQVDMVMLTAKKLTGADNLVYMGGCAMNNKYNQRLSDQWQGIWSLPSPGDYSSAIGAVLYQTKKHISWKQGIAKHLEIKYNKV